MEDEIQDKLEEIYNTYIDVKYKDVNLYDVYVKLSDEKSFCIPEKAFCILFLYDKRGTLEANITELKNRIDRNIVNLFKKVYN